MSDISNIPNKCTRTIELTIHWLPTWCTDYYLFI